MPHDAADPVGVNIVHAPSGQKVSHLTDLGHVTETVRRAIRGAHLLVLEANHDVHRLRGGDYPGYLKARILGDTGHLSNEAAVGLLVRTRAEPRPAHGLAGASFQRKQHPQACPGLRQSHRRRRDELPRRLRCRQARLALCRVDTGPFFPPAQSFLKLVPPDEQNPPPPYPTLQRDTHGGGTRTLGYSLAAEAQDVVRRPADTTAFEQFWQPHRLRVWRLVARLAGSVDLADDLTQEVSLRACQGFGTFRGGSSAYTWLYRIAVHVVLRHRERLVLDTVSWDSAAQVPDPSLTPQAAVLQAEIRPIVWAALDRLPDEQRTTIILSVYEELKYREIADVLEIPLGTVKSRLHTGIARLREELKDAL